MAFSVKDIVGVPSRRDLMHHGEITELRPDGMALVHFRMPRLPRVCGSCGMASGLSVNGDTGEVVCMRSGCGHEHGFDERDEEFSLDLLFNMTAERKANDKKLFRERLNELLEDGVSEQLLTSDVADQILQLV
jgi:hypothetical protein